MNRSASTTRCLIGSEWDDVFVDAADWPMNSYLVRQGALPSTIYTLDEGVVKMVHVTLDGNERVVDIRRAPAVIGAAFVIADCSSIVDVVTLTRCSLRWCSPRAFESALASDSKRAGDFLRWQCSEMAGFWERAIAMSARNSRERLEYFTKEYSAGVADTQPFAQSVVASFINVTPEHLSRLVKKMAKAGSASNVARLNHVVRIKRGR